MHQPDRRIVRRLAAAAAAGILLLSAVACGMGATPPAGPAGEAQAASAGGNDNAAAGSGADAAETGDSGAQTAALTPGDAGEVVSGEKERHATPTAAARPRRTPTATPTRAPPARSDGLPIIYVDQLPRQARDTLWLIEQDGPFPYDKDGSTFQNREGLLPSQPRGYYREYTVITPGENDRGARRIVAGDRGELYYTDDHYDSFSRILPR